MGRDDDIVVLVTGEKISPQILEIILNEAPMMKAAIAYGENWSYLGIIFELTRTTAVLVVRSFQDHMFRLSD